MIAFIGRSLRRRVMVLVLAATIAALALSALGLVVYDLRVYEKQWTNDLITQAEILARASAPALAFNDKQTAATDLTLMKVRPRVLGAAIYTRDGELFATYTRPGADMPPFPDKPLADGYRVDGEQLSLFRKVVEGGETIGTVYLRAYYQPWERLRDYLTILAVVMVASLAVVALISGYLQSAITMPILEVASVAREVMAQRDYSLRARKISDDEIGALVDSFNAMLAEAGRRAEALREADQRKDEFLATLAHELRNPLAPLRNALEILRVSGSEAPAAQKARAMMERQLNQMVRLVDDLLDVSRITTGKLAIRKEPIELQAALRDAIETARPFIETRRHELVVDLPQAPLIVEGDRTRLAQVFSNLLNNAAKYTEPGGRITFTLEQSAHEAVVTVKDTGLGLEPHSLSEIFDMFVQVDRTLERTHAGLGVGLTLSRRLVGLHGGMLVARSDGVGKGSEFEVRLPIAGTTLVGSSESPPPESAATPRRILVADDNVDFANSLGTLLTERGHDVRVVYNGADALATAARFHPQFAFLDIGMPKVHGYEVARRLREEREHCVLVAITGWGQADDLHRAKEAGFDRHLVKPAKPEEIDEILRGD